MAKSPVSLDKLKPFANASDSLGSVDSATASSLIAASADIALVLDPDGMIRDVSVASPDLAILAAEAWVGRSWFDTVNRESREKISELLAEVREKGASRWRQVNHLLPSGQDTPVRYCAVQLGTEGRLVAVGRDLRALSTLQQRLVEAQQSMEREYARIRSAETRYRLLFQLAWEAVVVVDAMSNRIIDANPSACRLLDIQPKRFVGVPFTEPFAEDSETAIQSMVAAARQVGRIDDVHVKLADGKTSLLLSASLFRQDNAAQLLVRIRTMGGAGSEAEASVASLLQVIERLPEAFVVTDLDRNVLAANSAFLELAQVATEQQVKGKAIERWIGRGSADVESLLANLKLHGSVRSFSTVLRGELDSIETVEIAAVIVDSGELPCIGFSIRGVGLRVGSGRTVTGPELPGAQQFTDLVGRVSLKDMVRETTDLIERLCIEAALELTRDNRTSAAEMLGLSRQSLYSKLRRFGLGDLDGDDQGGHA